MLHDQGGCAGVAFPTDVPNLQEFEVHITDHERNKPGQFVIKGLIVLVVAIAETYYSETHQVIRADPEFEMRDQVLASFLEASETKKISGSSAPASGAFRANDMLQSR